ncbi:MAG: hypothetical protein K2P70_13055 [Hyphomonadaceae bacterium]|nr:hypothetical protein [Hyphomonadaceae bacterium]
MILDLKLPQSEELTQRIDAAGFETLEYNKQWQLYRLSLTKADIAQKTETLRDLVKLAYEQRTN